MLGKKLLLKRAACGSALAILLVLSLTVRAEPTLDTSFGTNGTAIYTFPFPSDSFCGNSGTRVHSVYSMRNGNALAHGVYVLRQSNHCNVSDAPALAQFDKFGVLDRTFGDQGIVAPLDDGGILLLQRDDRIVGRSPTGLIRLNSDGSPDRGFVTDGASGLAWFEGGYWRHLAQQRDGKIVAAGYSANGYPPGLALARFNVDGTLDLSFNKTGGVLVPQDTDGGEDFGLALQADGRVVLASTVLFVADGIGYFTGVSVVRYNPDGTPDIAFGNNGQAIATAGTETSPYGSYVANGVLIQPNGRLVIFGRESRFATDASASSLLLLGFAPTGMPDGTFGSGGAVRFYPRVSRALTALVQPDGKLLVEIAEEAPAPVRIARFNVNGSPDPTFGSLVLDPESVSYATSIALQADGNMLLGRSPAPGSPYGHHFAVQRYISGPTAAIEYFNAPLNHYFITTNPHEVADLDLGIYSGWARTGLSFLTYGSAASATGTSANPVCRFHIPPQHGNSHFFSADPVECAIARDKIDTDPNFSGYVEETRNAFYIALPDKATGICWPNTTPVYRLWNQSAASNHRYTTSVVVRDQMIAGGWLAEGYGPDGVDMCAPQ